MSATLFLDKTVDGESALYTITADITTVTAFGEPWGNARLSLMIESQAGSGTFNLVSGWEMTGPSTKSLRSAVGLQMKVRLLGVDENANVPSKITVSVTGATSDSNVTSSAAFNSRDAATLAAAATFQGVGEDVSKYGRVGVSISSDNATDGILTMEVSHDNINWGGPTRTWADTRFAQPHMWNIVEKYFRIKYVNGTTEATNLSIQVQYSNNANILLGHQLNETLLDETEAIVVRSVAVGQDVSGTYRNVPVTGEGKLQVDIPTTAFGEMSVAEKTPQVQLRFPYNVVPPDIGQVLTNNAGSSVSVATAQASVTCAGAYPSFSQIRTLDTIRYGPGQGAEFEGTCAFTAGVALSSQVFGPGDDDEGLYFGYNGTSFGVMRRAYGSLEIRSLTITGAADAGGGTFTVTMDGTAVTVTCAGSETIAQVCALIVAEATAFGNAGRGWEVHTDDNVSVEFISFVAENAAGTFSFADVDSSVTAGTFAQGTTEVLGVAPTETWVAMASWNGDPMDGTGPSGITLDPTKLNVYKIQFQYLGAGTQEFFIEIPSTGSFQLVHRFGYSNANTQPWALDPTFHLNLIAKTESGYAGGALTMKTASMGGFIQGKENPDGVRRAVAVEKAMTTTEQVLLILHSELDFNGRKNKITTYPDLLNVSQSNTTKDMTVRLYKNPTSITGAAALTDIQAGVSVMQYSTTGTIVIGGAQLLAFEVPPSGSPPINLGELRVKIRPGDRFVFTGDMQSGSADANISITWVERI